MMRKLVFLLVLGNIVVFALSAGWLGSGEGEAVTASGETHQPLSPDRIRIVSRGEPPPLPELPKRCLEWGDLSAAQAGELEKLAGGNKSLGLLREETQAASASYWVFIPAPAGGKAGSEKKAAELKALGIKSFELVQEGGTDRWAISLGVHASEAQAEAALAGLRKAGVRSAKVGIKQQTPARFRIRLTGTEPALAPAQKLGELSAPAECPVEKTAAQGTPPAPAAVVPVPAAAAGADKP